MINYTTKYHYVYTIIEKNTNKKYIGVRSSNIHPSEDLGFHYFSSSTNNDFIYNQKINKQNYEYIVNAIFDNRDDANANEILLHELYNVAESDEYYNKSNATSTSFSTVGNVTVKDINGNILFVNKTDPRYLSGELVHMSTSKAVVKDVDGNIFAVSIDDPRYLSGQLVGVNKGKVIIKNESGQYIRVDKSELPTDKYQNMTTGKVSVRDKDGDTLLVDKDDPRFLSGELVGVNKGKVLVKDKDGNKIMVDKDDPRYLSGELVYHLTGRTVSEEIRKQQSIARTGKITKLTKKLYIDGNFYLSIKLASESLNITRGLISKRCNSNDPQWSGWYFT